MHNVGISSDNIWSYKSECRSPMSVIIFQWNLMLGCVHGKNSLLCLKYVEYKTEVKQL